ncbi:hypothetical protein EJB05_45956 [Eragrostis curvula]|uniref:LIM zinc-binding domain-containing protein n=1 Tax=Eragrostis curvula TaxID=38414 RepID=A0A5J9TN49_9POAL|nr:hypothetical protein EJB05_45956 [Eragrostis curvula]
MLVRYCSPSLWSSAGAAAPAVLASASSPTSPPPHSSSPPPRPGRRTMDAATGAGSRRVRIAVVGDVHNDWALEEDSKALQFLQPDLVLFTGDYGNENVELVQSISDLQFPKAAILGNHDCWNTYQFSEKKVDGVRLQLGSLGEQHVGYKCLDFPTIKLSVVGGRPFSCGGDSYGVNDMAGSAKKIYDAAARAPVEHFVILLAHNGPTGLGSRIDDICGRDWVPGGGDHGDPDLERAISDIQRETRVSIPLVVFGHMHKSLAYGRGLRKMIAFGANNTIYLNGAVVPRVKYAQPIRATIPSAEHNQLEESGVAAPTLHAFTIIELLEGRVEKISEVWVLVDGTRTELEEEIILYKLPREHIYNNRLAKFGLESRQNKDMRLEQDEQLARAIQESWNVEASPRDSANGGITYHPPRENGTANGGNTYQPLSFMLSSGFRICAGCHREIGYGRFLSCMGAVWHPECFRCHDCSQPIYDSEFSMSGSHPYHKNCYKERFNPKCDVCKNFPRDSKFVLLDDGRKLCLECLDSAVMDTRECQPLYLEIQAFYEGLNMKVKQQVPLLLVERQALNEAMDGEKAGHHHLSETRGLCLSEEQTVSTILRRPRMRGNRIMEMITEPYSLTRRCEVTAILILYGLPRLLTGSILAHEMMHAWLRLQGYPRLSPDVEEGICQVLAHMWIESEIMAGSSSNVASTSSASSTSTSSKKKERSQFEQKLGDFFKHQIESDTSMAYGDGFRAGHRAVLRYGLKSTLEHIRLTGTLPF